MACSCQMEPYLMSAARERAGAKKRVIRLRVDDLKSGFGMFSVSPGEDAVSPPLPSDILV